MRGKGIGGGPGQFSAFSGAVGSSPEKTLVPCSQLWLLFGHIAMVALMTVAMPLLLRVRHSVLTHTYMFGYSMPESAAARFCHSHS